MGFAVREGLPTIREPLFGRVTCRPTSRSVVAVPVFTLRPVAPMLSEKNSFGVVAIVRLRSNCSAFLAAAWRFEFVRHGSQLA